MNEAVLFAIIGACLNAANDLICRKSSDTRDETKVYYFYFFSAMFSTVFALVLACIAGNTPFHVDLIMTALKTGDVSLVIPITQLAFVLVAAVSWVVLKERMTGLKTAGIICAVPAVVMIS